MTNVKIEQLTIREIPRKQKVQKGNPKCVFEFFLF